MMRVAVYTVATLFTCFGCAPEPEEISSTTPAEGQYKGNSSFVVTAGAPADESVEVDYTFESISNRLGVLLPVEQVRADVMTLASNKRTQELYARFKESIAKHPEWWIEYSKSLTPEQAPPPYHPNMGISESEYEEMMVQANNLTMEKTGEANLLFLNKQNGQVEVFSSDLSHAIGILTIDFREDTVETPYGRLSRAADIDNNDPNSPSGAWSGPSWALGESEPDGPFGTHALFALGRLTADQRGVFYYKVTRRLPEQAPERLSLFLVYGDPN